MRMKFFTILMVFALVAGGCGKKEAGESANPTSSETQGETAAPVEDKGRMIEPRMPFSAPQVNNITPTQPMLLFFLLDSSGSVVGTGSGTNCPAPVPLGSPPAHRKSLMYLIDVLTDLHPDILASLHIGIGRFGSYYEEHYYRGDEINVKYGEIYNFVTLDANKDGSSSYENGLASSLTSIKKYSEENLIVNKHVFLFTDGFREEINIQQVERQIASYLESSVWIHVGLVCPDVGDTGFWAEHYVDTWREGPAQWMRAIFDLLAKEKYLPEQSGWVFGPSTIPVYFSPYATSGLLHYYEFEGENSRYVNVDVDGIRVKSDATYRKAITPLGDCSLPPSQLSLKTNMDKGFWWAEASLPEIPTIELKIQSSVNNAEKVSVTAHLKIQNLPNGELNIRRNCFSDLGLFTLGQDANAWERVPDVQIRPCEDGGSGLCPEKGGDSLYRTWDWTPQYDSPQSVYLAASWKYVVSNYGYASILFSPAIVEEPLTSLVPNSGNPQKIEVRFRSLYDASPPKIYLEGPAGQWASLTDEVRNKFNGTFSCPFPDESPNSGYEQSLVLQDVLLISEQNFFSFSAQPLQKYQNQYTLTAYEYIFSVCKVSSVLFVWEQNSDSTINPSRWKCAWKDSKIFPCVRLDS
ncbi:MAG: hypothetical protein Fur002_05000 [Anaerolineales bacterium]